ncbi:MAG: hypothetical protein WC634_04260 [archaeon]
MKTTILLIGLIVAMVALSGCVQNGNTNQDYEARITSLENTVNQLEKKNIDVVKETLIYEKCQNAAVKELSQCLELTEKPDSTYCQRIWQEKSESCRKNFGAAFQLTGAEYPS